MAIGEYGGLCVGDAHGTAQNLWWRSQHHRKESQSMNPSFSRSGQHLFDGTIRVFLAEALILPTGILTAAFLTRRLGPDDYGLFTIVAIIVVWIQTSITAFFSRP